MMWLGSMGKQWLLEAGDTHIKNENTVHTHSIADDVLMCNFSLPRFLSHGCEHSA